MCGTRRDPCAPKRPAGRGLPHPTRYQVLAKRNHPRKCESAVMCLHDCAATTQLQRRAAPLGRSKNRALDGKASSTLAAARGFRCTKLYTTRKSGLNRIDKRCRRSLTLALPPHSNTGCNCAAGIRCGNRALTFTLRNGLRIEHNANRKICVEIPCTGAHTRVGTR